MFVRSKEFCVALPYQADSLSSVGRLRFVDSAPHNDVTAPRRRDTPFHYGENGKKIPLSIPEQIKYLYVLAKLALTSLIIRFQYKPH